MNDQLAEILGHDYLTDLFTVRVVRRVCDLTEEGAVYNAIPFTVRAENQHWPVEWMGNHAVSYAQLEEEESRAPILAIEDPPDESMQSVKVEQHSPVEEPPRQMDTSSGAEEAREVQPGEEGWIGGPETKKALSASRLREWHAWICLLYTSDAADE